MCSTWIASLKKDVSGIISVFNQILLNYCSLNLYAIYVVEYLYYNFNLLIFNTFLFYDSGLKISVKHKMCHAVIYNIETVKRDGITF